MPGREDLNGSTSVEVLEEALSGHLAIGAGAKQSHIPTHNVPNVSFWNTYVRPVTLTSRPTRN